MEAKNAHIFLERKKLCIIYFDLVEKIENTQYASAASLLSITSMALSRKKTGRKGSRSRKGPESSGASGASGDDDVRSGGEDLGPAAKKGERRGGGG